MRLDYRDYSVTDGDTFEIEWMRLWWKVRIIGLDTDEKDEKTKRAMEQKQVLEKFFRKFFKPIVKPRMVKRQKGGQRLDGHQNRLLCYVWVWSWFRYVRYDQYMIKRKLVKKGSRWNGGV